MRRVANASRPAIHPLHTNAFHTVGRTARPVFTALLAVFNVSLLTYALPGTPSRKTLPIVPALFSWCDIRPGTGAVQTEFRLTLFVIPALFADIDVSGAASALIIEIPETFTSVGTSLADLLHRKAKAFGRIAILGGHVAGTLGFGVAYLIIVAGLASSRNSLAPVIRRKRHVSAFLRLTIVRRFELATALRWRDRKRNIRMF